MKNQLLYGVALFALVGSSAAYAQSTGTIAAEDETQAITVVTGTRNAKGIDGLQIPDTPKARTVIGQEFIGQQTPGQTILQTLNVVPSLNFTNTDPYGSSGGNIRLRGFDGGRISFTFDGMPLNDTGNYAIYSNQVLDPEIVAEVNVNQGTTDVDSPTASAAGGTINYRSINPSKEFGARVVGSIGRFQYRRFFGMVETGEFTKWGTRAYFSFSRAVNDKFKGPGEIQKRQFNGRVYQPIGDKGDFFALAGHHNRNRNNQYRNLSVDQLKAYYKLGDKSRYDNNPFCARLTPTAGGIDNEAAGTTTVGGKVTQKVTQQFETIPGVSEANCTSYAGVRINPSNTWNVHSNLKLTLRDNLVFTMDPSYQYVLANGGGYSNAGENTVQTRGAAINSKGVDLNGDGDTLDTVSLYTPNTTNTHRWTVLSSLRYDVSDNHYVRLAYAFDRGWHRQTGQAGYMAGNGEPFDVWGGRDGKGPKDATGTGLRTRDRRSIAMLNQISGEYRGFFFDRKLETQIGVRAPFFKRNLKQNCYTQYGGSFPSGTIGNSNQYCTTQPPATTGMIIMNRDQQPQDVNPSAKPADYGKYFYAPYKRKVTWNRVLPNAGLTYRPVGDITVFASYAKGFSAPRTDNLYRTPNLKIKPETTNNFDFGVRYLRPRIQVSLGAFYNAFKNRIVSAYNQELDITTDRNVGRVHSKGMEFQVGGRPLKWFSLTGSVSYLDAKYRDNLDIGSGVVLNLRGKRVVESPKWQFNINPEVEYKFVRVGFTVKKVTKRYTTDMNDQSVPGYTLVNLNARADLESFGLEKSFLQLNAINLFNKKTAGSIPTTAFAKAGVPGGGGTFVTATSPRAISLSLQVGF